MKLLQYAVLLFSLLAPPCSIATTSTAIKPVDRVHPSTHYFEMDSVFTGVHCSATTIGPHAVLTAGHCDQAVNHIKLDGKEYTVKQKIYDDSDHVIYIVDGTFSTFVPVTERDPEPSEHVFFYGNPGHSRDVYRDGWFMKATVNDDVEFDMYRMPVYGGDSGSGIFDDKGVLIGVVSVGDSSAEGGALPMLFTQEQLNEAVKE